MFQTTNQIYISKSKEYKILMKSPKNDVRISWISTSSSHPFLFLLATHSVRSAQVVFSFSPRVAFPLARGTHGENSARLAHVGSVSHHWNGHNK